MEQMDIEGENPIIQRLKQYIATTGLSSTQFADKACIPRPTFSQMLNGRNKSINNQVLSKLNESFPDLNILWLLFGRGNMREFSNIESSETQIGPSKSFETVKTPDLKGAGLFGPHETTMHDSPTNAAMSKSSSADVDIPGAWHASVLCSPPDESVHDGQTETTVMGKRIVSIIVLYSDNSFETFNPSSGR